MADARVQERAKCSSGACDHISRKRHVSVARFLRRFGCFAQVLRDSGSFLPILPRYLPAMIHTRTMGSVVNFPKILCSSIGVCERERRSFRPHFVPGVYIGVYIEAINLLRFEPRRSLWSLGKGVVAGRSRSLNIHLNWRSLSP